MASLTLEDLMTRALALLCVASLTITLGCDENTIGTFTNNAPAEFNCASDGTVLPLGYLCDGTADCADGSDEGLEAGCNIGDNDTNPDMFDVTCSDTQWQCWSSSQCIDVNAVCDGSSDCQDDSDEGGASCRMSCNELGYACLDGSGSIACDLLCDGGTPDCADGSDEVGCN